MAAWADGPTPAAAAKTKGANYLKTIKLDQRSIK
jgi:hypothetical protein